MKKLTLVAALVLIVSLVATDRIALGRAYNDPVGDLFDRQGRSVTAEAYLDIVEVEVLQSGAEYSVHMKMNGPLPSSLSDPVIFIEWGLLVDIDQNPGTCPWGSWPLMDNGIGVDVLIRLMFGPSGEGYRGEIRDLRANRRLSIPFKVEGASIELKYNSSVVGIAPKAFDYVFEARKFGNYGNSGAEIACDKVPNEGYFTFSDNQTSLVTTRITTTRLSTGTISQVTTIAPAARRYEGPMIDAHAHAMQWTTEWQNSWGRSWMIETMNVYRKAGVDKVIFFDGFGALMAHTSKPDEIIPSLYILYMNRTRTLVDVKTALEWGFPWVGEALLRHHGVTNTSAEDPVALQIYDLCAKYQAPITIHQDPAQSKGAYEELERALERCPGCIFIMHGWWLGWQQIEGIIIRHPNLYVELAGELETERNEFLGNTARDQFAYPDGSIREGWRTIFQRYPDRVINGFDLFTDSAYTFENLKMRVDYFRNLFGQINQSAAERICYKNVEDLLAKRICVMNVSLSTDRAAAGDQLTITAQLRNMGATPIRNETVSFFLERSDGKLASIGEAKTDKSGLATLNYRIDAIGGSYWIVTSHPESPSYSYRSARAQLTVNQPTTTKTTVTDSTAIPSSIPQSNYAPYIVAGTAATVLIILLVRAKKSKKTELPEV